MLGSMPSQPPYTIMIMKADVNQNVATVMQLKPTIWNMTLKNRFIENHQTISDTI